MVVPKQPKTTVTTNWDWGKWHIDGPVLLCMKPRTIMFQAQINPRMSTTGMRRNHQLAHEPTPENGGGLVNRKCDLAEFRGAVVRPIFGFIKVVGFLKYLGVNSNGLHVSVPISWGKNANPEMEAQS